MNSEFSFSWTGCHTKVKESSLPCYLPLARQKSLEGISFASPAFWLGRLAFVPGGRSINGRFEAERPPTSAEPPSGGRAAFLTPMYYLYSTRPHGLVQAIF